MSDIQHAKAEIRRRVRSELQAMTPVERIAASQQACARLEEQAVWRKAKSVLFYSPMPEELDVWPLFLAALATGKTVALPRFHPEKSEYYACEVREPERELGLGRFGVREPNADCPTSPLKHLDLILVPGVAFDFEGRRLGRGKGFYDRLLAGLSGSTCGVAFDFQIVSRIPVEAHDVGLHGILTPTRWQAVAAPGSVLK